jgi:hypothetical protein
MHAVEARTEAHADPEREPSTLPDRSTAAMYDQLFAVYRGLYPALMATTKRLAQMALSDGGVQGAH